MIVQKEVNAGSLKYSRFKMQPFLESLYMAYKNVCKSKGRDVRAQRICEAFDS